MSMSLSGCVSTIVGAVVDTTIEVVKIPFKIGGAIADGVSGSSKKKNKQPDEQDENNTTESE